MTTSDKNQNQGDSRRHLTCTAPASQPTAYFEKVINGKVKAIISRRFLLASGATM